MARKYSNRVLDRCPRKKKSEYNKNLKLERLVGDTLLHSMWT